MAYKFEVGKTYEWMESSFDPIKVVGRTKKTVRVTNAFLGGKIWRMLIRTCEDGTEYVIDSSMPKSHRDEFTCYASHDEEWRLRG